MKWGRNFLFIIFVLLFISIVKGREIYVDDITGEDNNLCGVINSPCKTINYAISISYQLETIIVLPGTYLISSSIKFDGKGGILKSRDGENFTYISPSIECIKNNCQAIIIDIIDKLNPPLISGFTFEEFNNSEMQGAVISIMNSSPSVFNCTFRKNNALMGGAIHIQNSNCKISNCKFYNNIAKSGGAISIEVPSFHSLTTGEEELSTKPFFINCLFYSNIASEGGSVFLTDSADFFNCIFKDHFLTKDLKLIHEISDYKGGVISVSSIKYTNFYQCLFDNITATNIPGTGGVFFISGNVVISNSDFFNTQLNNSFTNTGSVFSLTQSSNLQVNGSKFIGNSAGYGGLGGCLFANMFSQSSFYNCTFINNTALMGGCFYISNGEGDGNKNITTHIIGSSLISNKATFGGAIYILGRNSNLLLGDSFVYDNFASSGGGMYITGVLSGFLAYNNQFINNKALFGTGGAVYYVNCIPELYGCFSSSNSSSQSSIGVCTSETSLLEIEFVNCEFTKNEAMREGGALSLTSSSLKFIISNCNFTENIGASAGAIYSFDITYLFINLSQFSFNQATEKDGGALSLDEIPFVSIFSSKFDSNSAYSKGGSLSITQSNTNISNSFFIHNYAAITGGAISCSQNDYQYNNYIGEVNEDFQTNIENCEFIDNHIYRPSYLNNNNNLIGGGALNLESYIGSLFNLILKNNSVVGNGGGIRIEGLSNINITNLHCSHNFASEKGGCISNSGSFAFFSCFNCKFLGNEASSFGGGVSSYNKIEVITGDIEGNKASVGGGIYIENIYQINETKIDQQIKFINNTANCYGNDRATSIASIEWQKAPPLGIAPEIQFFSVEIGLFDSFQQSVNCISEFLEIKLSSRGSSLIGELTQFVNTRGKTIFSDLRITGHFNTTYFILATLKYSNNNINSNNDGFGWMSSSAAPITILTCPAGYQFNTQLSLHSCHEAGTYNIKGDGICVTCPKGGICIGGSSVLADVGYWRKTFDLSTAIFYYCANSENCCPQGFCSIDQPCSLTRRGVLCSECKDGLSEWGGICTVCDEIDWEVIIILLILSMIFVGWLLVYPFAYWGLPNAIIYFIQTAPLLMSSESTLAQILNSFNLQFDLAQKIVILLGGEMCLFPVNSLSKLIIPFVIPSLFIISLIVIWIFTSFYKLFLFIPQFGFSSSQRKVFKGMWERHTNAFILTLGNIFNFAYLSITVTCLNILVPAYINGEFVVGASPSANYFEIDHLYLIFVAILILILFSIGLPLMVIKKVNAFYHRSYSLSTVDLISITSGQLKRSISRSSSLLKFSDEIHKQIHYNDNNEYEEDEEDEYDQNIYSTKSKTYSRFGPFYFGFKPQYRFWKSIVFFQRAMLATLYVTLTYLPAYQSIFMSFWCITISTIHSFIWPWRSQYVNITESICLFCLALLSTLKVSSVFLSDESGHFYIILSGLIVLIPIFWLVATLSYKGGNKVNSKIKKWKHKWEEPSPPSPSPSSSLLFPPNIKNSEEIPLLQK